MRQNHGLISFEQCVRKPNTPSRSRWKLHRRSECMPPFRGNKKALTFRAQSRVDSVLLRDWASFTGTAEAAGLLQRKHPSNKPCSGQYMSERSSRQLRRKRNFYFLRICCIKSTQKRFQWPTFLLTQIEENCAEPRIANLQWNESDEGLRNYSANLRPLCSLVKCSKGGVGCEEKKNCGSF